MKKSQFIFLLVIFLGINISSAQIFWKKYDSCSAYQNTIISCSEGGFILATTKGILNSPLINESIVLFRLNDLGDTLWSTKFYGDSIVNSHSLKIIQTYDSCFALLGYYWDSTHFGSCLVKIDQLGNILWMKTYNNFCEVYYTTYGEIVESIDHGFVITLVDTGNTIMFYKTDSSGSIQWMKKYTAPEKFIPRGIRQLSDSGFVILSSEGRNQTIPRTFLIRTTKNGNLLWSKTISNIANNGARDIILLNDTTYVLSISNGLYSPKLNGDTSYLRTYSSNLGSYITSISLCKNGDYIISGPSINSQPNSVNVYTA